MGLDSRLLFWNQTQTIPSKKQHFQEYSRQRDNDKNVHHDFDATLIWGEGFFHVVKSEKARALCRTARMSIFSGLDNEYMMRC